MLIYILWFGAVSYFGGWCVSGLLQEHEKARFNLSKTLRKILFMNRKGEFVLSVIIYQSFTVLSTIWAVSMFGINRFVTDVDLFWVDDVWRQSRWLLFIVFLLPNIIRITAIEIWQEGISRRSRRRR